MQRFPYSTINKTFFFVRILLMFFLLNTSVNARAQTSALSAYELRCEHNNNPFIEVGQPHLSWQLKSKERNQSQNAYQILVASSIDLLKANRADLWDTKKVNGTITNGIKYSGRTIASGERCFWKVRSWNQKDKPGPWSAISQWEMALPAQRDWKASWITFDPARASAQPILRKAFTLKQAVKKATAHISGLGYYELYINGNKIGDHVLDPAQTNYDDYALYVSYDITKQLKKDKNGVGVMLGDGWYNQDKVWGGAMKYGKPLMICQIDIEYTDGTKTHVVSDQSWQWTNGPVIKSNVYAGEVYDSRKEIKDWSKPEMPSGSWMPVLLAANHPPKLKLQQLPPIKKMKELNVKKFYKIDSNRYIFDFGQNFAGWTRLKISAPAGTVIKIRMAEAVDKQGKLDSRSTGVSATLVEQTEEYTCKGGAEEIWEPRFTYHGFQYAEVSGLPSAPASDLLKGIVVYSAVPEAGVFSCSDEQINHLHELAKWTLTSNLHGFPTDCPHREKCGWLGDAQVIANTSIYNFDMETFWIKYLQDVRSTGRDSAKKTLFHVASNSKFRMGFKEAGVPYMIAPGKRLPGVASAEWGTAVVQIPWNLYVNYGNKDVLKEFYHDMETWVIYAHTLTKDNIIYEGLGDWCPPGGNKTIDCPIALSSTAFHYLDLSIMAQTADILGKTAERDKYLSLKRAVKAAFNAKFFDATNNTYGGQTADALALDLDLTPEGTEKMVSDDIVKNITQKHGGFMHAGIFGLPRLFNVLSRYGNESAAFSVLTKKGNNSFENMWKAYGATTLWEVLPTDTINNDSRNHPMQGGYDQWFYHGILGIGPDASAPGYKIINLEPKLTDQLNWAKGSYQSVYGEIKSNWERTGKIFKWSISIPANTTAIVHIPAKSKEDINESGTSINKKPEIGFVRMDNNKAILKLGGGDYQFTVQQDAH